jgi:hypothetical protein
MLELRGASYRYAGYAAHVLHEIDLTLGDGEIVGSSARTRPASRRSASSRPGSRPRRSAER